MLIGGLVDCERAEIVSCRCQRFVIGFTELKSNNVFHVSNLDMSITSPVSGVECNANAHSAAGLELRSIPQKLLLLLTDSNVIALSPTCSLLFARKVSDGY